MSLLSRHISAIAATSCVLALCAASAQAQTIRPGSGLARGLPDGRAYEQVTPANKDNGDPYLRAGIFAEDRVNLAGNRVSYFSLYGFPGVKVYGLSYLATRGKNDWVSQNLIPRQSADTSFLCAAYVDMVAYSSDMSEGILADGANQSSGCSRDDPRLVSGEPRGVQNLFLRDNATGTYQLISLNPVSGPPADANYDGASTNLSHVVFDESAQLTSDSPSGDDLYDWSAGAVKLVTEVPSSGTSCTGVACTPTVGVLAGGALGNVMHAVSADGSRIFFNANGNLYVRQNGSTTVQVDAPASGAPGPGGGGAFAAASADGSKVFFTDDSSAGLTSNTQSGSGANLYEYNVSTNTLTDLTATSDAQVQGLAGASVAGSYLYFVADGSLASGATAGQPNLYVFHNGTTTFIATLNPSDGCDWTSCLTSRVSTNGQFLAFESTNSLTGYNNTDRETKSPDDEIFVYNAATGALACASCSGGRPIGNTVINAPEESGSEAGNVDILERYVSNAGQLFFDTPDALLPTDTNGLQDVYEYEVDGSGTCTQAGGCPYLLSSGTSDASSFYFDNTPSGSDALFVTSQQLVPTDTDGAYDIYDARVDGGFPAPKPPPPPCVGESCKPPPKSPPSLPVVATITFSGGGNHSTEASQKAVKGSSFRVAVAVPRKGRITISGAGIQTARQSASKAGRYKLRVSLNRREKRKLKLWGRLKLSISVRYAPTAGRAATARFKLTVKA